MGQDTEMATALIVLTSHDQLGDTGRSTGAYLPEVAEAWDVFSAAGYDVRLASVRGGRPPLEAVDTTDPVQQAFLGDPAMSAGLDTTPTLADIDPRRYSVVFLAGGHGTAWDFPGHAPLIGLIRTAWEEGGVVAAVCHGPAGLVDVTLSDGTYLVAGRRVAAFTDDEERAIGMTRVVPFLLSERLAERGAHHDRGPSFVEHVVTDGRLVTGQNPYSARGVAQAALRTVGATGHAV